jgi:hypothetical protein
MPPSVFPVNSSECEFYFGDYIFPLIRAYNPGGYPVLIMFTFYMWNQKQKSRSRDQSESLK